MSIRYVVRPNHILTTPKALKIALGARRTVPVSSSTRVDYDKDLFLAYPSVDRVDNAPDGYSLVRDFYGANKRDQRKLLLDLELPAIPVGFTPTGDPFDLPEYICRPLRHSGGESYEILNYHQARDRQLDTSVYLSPAIRKKKEYRVVFLKGKEVAVYLKQVPEGTGLYAPWNRTNGSYFVTCLASETHSIHPLREQLANVSLTKTAHLIAYDIIKDTDNKYWICEANFCPAISIDRTIEKIKGLIDAARSE